MFNYHHYPIAGIPNVQPKLESVNCWVLPFYRQTDDQHSLSMQISLRCHQTWRAAGKSPN